MSDSNGTKFINKETISYLKAKRGEDVEKQIQNIKSRLDVEYNYLNHLMTDSIEEVTSKINHLSTAAQDTRISFDTRLQEVDERVYQEIETMKDQLRFSKIVAISLAVGGLVLWLIKSLT